jgi:hypothetical protein
MAIAAPWLGDNAGLEWMLLGMTRFAAPGRVKTWSELERIAATTRHCLSKKRGNHDSV